MQTAGLACTVNFGLIFPSLTDVTTQEQITPRVSGDTNTAKH
jgi:hypothetical protein